jgi:hypothetical protein
MSILRWPTVARGFRRLALPLGSYYAVTLALPLANGATPSASFMEHALVVLIVPAIAVVLGCAIHTIAHAFARLCVRIRSISRPVRILARMRLTHPGVRVAYESCANAVGGPPVTAIPHLVHDRPGSDHLCHRR